MNVGRQSKLIRVCETWRQLEKCYTCAHFKHVAVTNNHGSSMTCNSGAAARGEDEDFFFGTKAYKINTISSGKGVGETVEAEKSQTLTR